jgi:hypothetical protein
MAVSSEIINKGMLSDAIFYELASPKVGMLASGRLSISSDDAYQITEFRNIFVQEQARIAEKYFDRYWKEDKGTGEGRTPPLENLDAAMVDEFGFSFSDAAKFIGETLSLGRMQQDEPKRMPVEQFVAAVSSSLDWSTTNTMDLLEFFSLRADRKDQPIVTGEYPWRFNRDRSYIRRPFIWFGSGDTAMLCWGVRHANQAGQHLADLFGSGRLKAKGLKLKTLISRTRSEKNEAFNDEVANALGVRMDLLVLRRVKRFGKLRIARAPGQEIGDIDVLAVNSKRRSILLIETKDFEVAKTPSELSNEIRKLVDGEKSATNLHLERERWLRAHLREVLQSLGLPADVRRWTVGSVVVVSAELISPYVRRLKGINVVSLHRFIASSLHRFIASSLHRFGDGTSFV